MVILKSCIVGIVQGLTEFLPVSSSAHLVFAQSLLGWQGPDILFDVALHFATMLAVIIFLWKDIIALLKNPRVILLVAIGTVPAGLIGVLFKKSIENAFTGVSYSAAFLIVTGFILYFTRLAREKEKEMPKYGILDVILVGIAQGIALLPGISRSGSTMSAGMYLGWKKVDAVKFSFLLSIPAILGAAVLELKDAPLSGVNPAGIVPGMVFAFLTGLASIYILIGIVRKAKLHYFAYYCWAAGAVVLALSYLR
jgi:undecaprenyl-diphosphatase